MDPATAEPSGIFVLPVRGKFLLYSPLHDFAALLNRTSVLRIQRALAGEAEPRNGPLRETLEVLRTAPTDQPAVKQGGFTPPFLGLIPTRACNLACSYCGFWCEDGAEQRMSPALVRTAVDWYLGLVCQQDEPMAEIHFFGGEPFSADQAVDFAVHYAERRAREIGVPVCFEIATNGTFDARRCRWVADRFSTVVVSLDGPRDIHDRQRPHRGGQGSFDAVARSARILSDGPADLCIRACITSDTAARMEEIAAFFCEAFRPQSVCFETLQPSAQSQAAGLQPPDPWFFALGYLRAVDILEANGVKSISAPSDIQSNRVTFCPVGKDAAIVSPDGEIAACYLLRTDWESRGLDLRLGKLDPSGPACLDADAVESVRQLSVLNRSSCKHCFCRWHCAGGCHVNHRLPGPPGSFDHLCIQTRIITLRNILVAMDQAALVWELVSDTEALKMVITQPSDELIHFGPHHG